MYSHIVYIHISCLLINRAVGHGGERKRCRNLRCTFNSKACPRLQVRLRAIKKTLGPLQVLPPYPALTIKCRSIYDRHITVCREVKTNVLIACNKRLQHRSMEAASATYMMIQQKLNKYVSGALLGLIIWPFTLAGCPSIW